MLLPSLLRPPERNYKFFLSSTFDDYRDIRQQVKDAVEGVKDCYCPLIEDQTNTYNPTVALCQQWIQDSDGFILMLGYWYGSTPPGESRSITHLEFEYAFNKWGQQPEVKMAVFKPKPPSETHTKLQQRASGLIEKLAPDKQATHSVQLKAFEELVNGGHTEWRFIRDFEDVGELRERVAVTVSEWKGLTLLAAALGQVEAQWQAPDPRLSDDMLGQIGRNPQYNAIESILANVAASPQTPAIALLIHGEGNQGQSAFLSYILASLLKDHYPKQPVSRLPVKINTLPSLVGWVAGTLLGKAGSGVESIEQLADKVAAELKHQALYFTLDCISDLAGGVAFFQQEFWLPFFARLETLRAQQKIPHRLLALVTDYSGDSGQWGTSVAAAGSLEEDVDYTKLLPIPKLGPFKRSDLLTWFGRVKVPEDDTGTRLVALADRLLKNERGEAEPLPPRVFDRLKRETLWPEGGNP